MSGHTPWREIKPKADRQMTQYAPWPEELEQAVEELHGVVIFKNWIFWLSDEPRDYADEARTVPLAGGLTFNIIVPCYDSYHPEKYRPVHHLHPVPAATFHRAAWERWLFDRTMDTLRHEAAECFCFADDRRP